MLVLSDAAFPTMNLWTRDAVFGMERLLDGSDFNGVSVCEEGNVTTEVFCAASNLTGSGAPLAIHSVGATYFFKESSTDPSFDINVEDTEAMEENDMEEGRPIIGGVATGRTEAGDEDMGDDGATELEIDCTGEPAPKGTSAAETGLRNGGLPGKGGKSSDAGLKAVLSSDSTDISVLAKGFIMGWSGSGSRGATGGIGKFTTGDDMICSK